VGNGVEGKGLEGEGSGVREGLCMGDGKGGMYHDPKGACMPLRISTK
jgi:hypothetical protein